MAMITDEQIRLVFDLFDADGSSFVDTDELGLCMQALGFGEIPWSKLRTILLVMFADEDGGANKVSQKIKYDDEEADGEAEDDEGADEENAETGSELPQELSFTEFKKFVHDNMAQLHSHAEMELVFANYRNFKEEREKRRAKAKIGEEEAKKQRERISQGLPPVDKENQPINETPKVEEQEDENKSEEEIPEVDKGPQIITLDDFLAVADDIGEFLPRVKEVAPFPRLLQVQPTEKTGTEDDSVEQAAALNEQQEQKHPPLSREEDPKRIDEHRAFLIKVYKHLIQYVNETKDGHEKASLKSTMVPPVENYLRNRQTGTLRLPIRTAIAIEVNPEKQKDGETIKTCFNRDDWVEIHYEAMRTKRFNPPPIKQSSPVYAR